MPARGQRTYHDALVGTEVWQYRFGHVPQPSGHAVALHSVADGFGNHQTDAWSLIGRGVTSCMHDDIRLRRSHPVLDGGAELRRPCHPELGREHAA